MSYLLDDVHQLKREAEALMRRYLAIIPEDIKTEHWIDAHRTPAAWEGIAMKYPCTPGVDGVTTLGTVIAWLDGLMIRERSVGTKPDLRLGRMRH